MDQGVLLSLLLKYVDEKITDQHRGPQGPRGFRGVPGDPGKDFVLSENEEVIKSWIKEFSLKFSDLSHEEIKQLTGPQGPKGDDGKDFIFSEHEESLQFIIKEELDKNYGSLKLKFSDLSDTEKEELRGPRGHRGESGKSFVFDEHKEYFDSLKLKFSDLTKEEVEELKLTFSKLTDSEKEELRGPKGNRGEAGKSFVFDEHKEYFDSLKLKFSDLSLEEIENIKLKFNDLTDEEKDSLKLKFKDLSEEDKIALKGARGQRGKTGSPGIQGEKGDTGERGPTGLRGLPGAQGLIGLTGPQGLDGRDGKDAPVVVDVSVNQKKVGEFSLSFLFSDGSEIETPTIDIPLSEVVYIAGGFSGGGGGTGGGVGPQGPPGADGADGADGLSAYELWLAEGNTGTLRDFLDSLVGPTGPQGPPGSGSGDLILVDVPCETSVYVKSFVRLDKSSEVASMMSDWTTLLETFYLDFSTYGILAKNALADNIENSNVIGMVESKSSPTLCTIRLSGITSALFFSLDVEDEYYLSPIYPGAIVPSGQIPDTVGQIMIKVGQPLNPTQMILFKGERTFVEES